MEIIIINLKKTTCDKLNNNLIMDGYINNLMNASFIFSQLKKNQSLEELTYRKKNYIINIVKDWDSVH